jgi:hypothetical protein
MDQPINLFAKPSCGTTQQEGHQWPFTHFHVRQSCVAGAIGSICAEDRQMRKATLRELE